MQYLVPLITLILSFLLFAYLLSKYCKVRGNIKYHYKSTSFNAKIKKLMKSLPEYSPNFFLFNHYAKMTLLMRSRVKILQHFRRELLHFSDGGTIALDFYPKNSKKTLKKKEKKSLEESENLNLGDSYQRQEKSTIAWTESTTQKPLIILVPGTASQSNDRYVFDIVKQLYQFYGLETVVANRRGYAGVDITGGAPLSWVRTEDMDETIAYFQSSDRYKYRPLYLLGTSIGANFVYNYIADITEKNRTSVIKAAVAISPPWNLLTTAQKVAENRKLELHVLQDVKNNMGSHDDNQTYLKWLEEIGLTPEDVASPKSCREFDDQISTKMYGFETAQEYYAHYSVNRRIKLIQKPMLSITSVMDPVIETFSQDRQMICKNENIFQVNLYDGGHLTYPHTLSNINYAALMTGKYIEFIEKELIEAKQI